LLADCDRPHGRKPVRLRVPICELPDQSGGALHCQKCRPEHGPYGFICTGPLPAGTYYIMVANWAPDPDCINYTLRVFPCECPGPCPYPDRDDEVNNNTCGAADPVVACHDTLCGTIADSSDVDWYQITVPEGVCDTLVVKVFGDDTPNLWPYGRGLDPKAYIYASDCLTQLAYNDDNHGTYPEPVNYDSKAVKGCLEAGTYYIEVTAYGPGSGPYVLVVECIACECPAPCETFMLCGTPGEVESNDLCPPPVEQAEIGCDMSVYGLHCPEWDTDFWKVVVQPMTTMILNLYSGPDCLVNPAQGIYFRYYSDVCASPTTGTTGPITIVNNTPGPLVKYLEVYDNGGQSRMLCNVTATCCAFRDYCADPIVAVLVRDTGGVYTLDSTVNTCCATNVIDTVWRDGCRAGYKVPSGPDVIFKIILRTSGTMRISASSVGSGDGQFYVFTDCASPQTTCIASEDHYSGTTVERDTLAVAADTYYVAVSNYGLTACGQMHLRIECYLPAFWNNVSGGSWFTPGNWTPYGVPGTDYDVSITLAGTYTVSIDSGDVRIRRLDLGADSGVQTLQIVAPAQQLTLSRPSLIDSNGRLNVGHNTLTIGDG
jgi:hypothetical protein